MNYFKITHKISIIAWSSTSLTSDTYSISLLQYLDENKQLILAILENQNLGKLAECAQ